MVKIKDMVTEEKGRIQLSELQYFMDELDGVIELKAISEKVIEPGTRKETIYKEGVPVEVEHPVGGGLQIEYITRPNFANPYDFNAKKPLRDLGKEPEMFPEGMKLPQKYGKQGGTIMVDHLVALKLNDTVQLQEKFYRYRLRQQRSGHSRLYPVEAVD